jgi:phage shock protein A/DNA-binding XRE family transcriptional regulator
MGYQLRMHDQIRDWLTDLRNTEPELARLVGEAVLAMIEAGDSLGPPLVVPPGSVLRPPDDPRAALDYSYQSQLEALQKVRRGVADVATSRKRVELQVSQLEAHAAKFARQHQAAVDAGQEDVASDARSRQAGAQEQLSELRRQLSALRDEEERLVAASQRLQAKVEAFRTRKETLKASYTAAEGFQAVREAFADIGEDASDLEVPNAQAGASSESGRAQEAADEVLEEIADLTRTSDDSGSADQGGVEPPPGLMELRPGAPDRTRVGLLFVVEPQDTAVLVARVEDPGGPPDEYQEVIRLAASRLAMAQSAATASAVAFISYDAESFLDEFFPGEETEVELGAAALIARHRAHTLAQARQRMGLTQAQVARRMNVRQERVSAIERAEPGATEVRTLAAYVSALGGRLEIIAGIGGDRIVLR